MARVGPQRHRGKRINTTADTDTQGSIILHLINPLTPNDPYRSRTAPLNSKVTFYIFIQQI